MLIVARIFILVLSLSINFSNMPLFIGKDAEFISWRLVIPVFFTSFGFQVIFHTLSDYCEMNKDVLRRVFLFGSLIPAIVYLIWTSSTLCVIYDRNPDFYALIAAGEINVEEFVGELGKISGLKVIQVMT
jgi:tyrosine-specific transport protein